MALRVGQSHPIYGEGCKLVTIVFHHGGQFVHAPKASYRGGETVIYDFVEVADVNLLLLDDLCDLRGLVGFKRYYIDISGGFLLIQNDKAVREVCTKHLASNTNVHLYVDIDRSLMDDQLGSSNDVKNRAVNGEENLCDEFDFNETNTDESWDEEDKEEEEDEDDRMFDENVYLNDELVGLEGTNATGRTDFDSDTGSIDLAASDDELEAQHTVEKQTDDTLGVNTTVLEKPLTGIKKLFKDVDVERGPTGAPLTFPCYRLCPTTGSMVPNFHFRNGAHYLPISCIKKALEQKNKPPNED